MKLKVHSGKYSVVTRYRGRMILFDNDTGVYVAMIRRNSVAQEFTTLEDAYNAIDNVCDWR